MGAEKKRLNETFFWAPKTYVKNDGYENINCFTLKIFVYLNLWRLRCFWMSLEKLFCRQLHNTFSSVYSLGQIEKKIPVFRVTWLVKPRIIFLQVFRKKYYFMHFERHFAFQNALNYIFSGKKKWLKKNVCLPYLKFSDLLPETHMLFLFGLIQFQFTFWDNCWCHYKERPLYYKGFSFLISLMV